jgi:hypothetical protein
MVPLEQFEHKYMDSGETPAANRPDGLASPRLPADLGVLPGNKLPTRLPYHTVACSKSFHGRFPLVYEIDW